MSRLLAFSLVAIASTSFAQPTRKPLKQAADALGDASDRARRQGGSCQQTISADADRLADRVASFGRSASSRELRGAMDEVATLASNASWSRCNDAVVQSLHRATDALEDARRASWNPNGPAPSDDDNGYDLASIGNLQVQLNASYDREPAVKLTVPELTLRRMRGQLFYLGARFRSYEGNWSEWITTQQWNVPSDPFVWRNAFQHYFRYSTLAEEDFANGRFIARVSVFDSGGREIAFREVSFRAQLPNLPPAPPPVVAARDCGTGPDIGCTMSRDGRFPLDGPTFDGFVRSLRSTNSEMLRAQTAQSMFANAAVTAVQFGLILDLFQSDMLRFQVAQAGAPRVVNPQHALGYAAKFNSDMLRAQYSQMMAQQQPGMGSGEPMPPPRHNPYRPPSGPRDCGTGPNDPGCTMMRNGRAPMDGVAFSGLLQALRTTNNEIVRQDLARDTVRNSAFTAMQLGQVMSTFNNELVRLDVAKAAAPYVVNPQHALGFASLFQNSILGNDFVQLMSRQR